MIMMYSSKVLNNGYVKIPDAVAKSLDLNEGDTLGFIINDDDTVTLIKIVEDNGTKDYFKFKSKLSWEDLYNQSFQDAMKKGDIHIKFVDFE